MATLTVVATMPEAQALHRALVACAEALEEDDDPRTRGQKMLDCLLDLVLRPGESELPPVQVLLTVVASIATLTGGSEPGEIDGQVVPAEMVRQLLAALTGAGLGGPAEAGTDVEGTDANGSDAAPQPCPTDAVGRDGREQQDLASWWAEMERRILSGELIDPDPEAGPPFPADLGHPLLGDGPGDVLHDGFWDDDGPPGRVGTHAQPAPAADARWWATADRALDDAGQAVEEARRTLAWAERAVRMATTADVADENASRTGPAGRVTQAEDAIAALWAATGPQRDLLSELLSMAGGGGLVERPRIALTDALSGALVALGDLPELRRAGSCGRAACRRPAAGCSHDLSDRPGIGPPGTTDGYRPGAQLDRFVRARDRRCRFPGCGRRVPRGGELDHSVAYPLGATSAANLVGYCTTHHRGKHQAPGWVHRLDADGTLTVTTPTGLVAVTTPPPY
jgi:hypothetical protein